MVEASAINFSQLDVEKFTGRHKSPDLIPHLWDSWNPECESGVIAQILTNALRQSYNSR